MNFYHLCNPCKYKYSCRSQDNPTTHPPPTEHRKIRNMSTKLDPTQPNPIGGSTQPMDNSESASSNAACPSYCASVEFSSVHRVQPAACDLLGRSHRGTRIARHRRRHHHHHHPPCPSTTHHQLHTAASGAAAAAAASSSSLSSLSASSGSGHAPDNHSFPGSWRPHSLLDLKRTVHVTV